MVLTCDFSGNFDEKIFLQLRLPYIQRIAMRPS
jgi:hypothetical protein